MMNEVVRFLRFPSYSQTLQKMSLSLFFRFLLLKFAIAIPFLFTLFLIGADEFDHALSMEEDENLVVFGIFGVVLAPLIEESIYRLHLDLKRSNVFWSLILSFLTFRDNWVPFALTFLYLSILLFYVLRKKTPELKWVIFSSAVLFGLAHMANYPDFDYGSFFYLIPFLIGSQACGGMVLSYIRLNHGMKWAILNHAAFNTILFLPIFFLE